MTQFILGLVTGFLVAAAMIFLVHRGMIGNPVNRIRKKAIRDLKTRLSPEGMPLNYSNDYERHLYALSLKRMGKSRDEIKESLLKLTADIPHTKRAKYVEDILNSLIVDYKLEDSKC